MPNGKSMKPRKSYKRKNTKAKKPVLGVGSVYNYTRYASVTVGTGTAFVLPASSSQISTNFVFTLANVRNYTDFTNLYDNYRIDKIDLFFKLVTNPDAQTSTTLQSSYFPTLWWIKDLDDSSSMTVADMQERQGVKRIAMKPDEIKKISIKPYFQKMAYQTLTSTGYGPATGWLDCNDYTVPHYALKTVFNVPTTGIDWAVEVMAKYHISFKGVQ